MLKWRDGIERFIDSAFTGADGIVEADRDRCQQGRLGDAAHGTAARTRALLPVVVIRTTRARRVVARLRRGIRRARQLLFRTFFRPFAAVLAFGRLGCRFLGRQRISQRLGRNMASDESLQRKAGVRIGQEVNPQANAGDQT